jgi:hypothetical protein
VGEAIRDHKLWAPGETVALAVSGGADSVALLDLVVSTAGWHRGVLSVVTVDHGTREGSAADADYVASLAFGYGLACHRVRVAPTGTSASLNEAPEIISTSFSLFTFIEKLPLASAEIPELLPFTFTVANDTGLPSMSVTFPVTINEFGVLKASIAKAHTAIDNIIFCITSICYTDAVSKNIT